MYQYLTKDNIFEKYRTSKQWTEGLTDKFPEYERIARNLPHPSIPKELPKTTDGTTAAIIRKTPHRIVQQLPTGEVESDAEDWLSVVAEFIYTHKIIPHANQDYSLIQKCWLVIERILTFGFTATYTPFTEHNGYFCSDMKLVYWADIFLQPGKLSDTDSNYIFMRTWWQTSDIDALIDAQKKIDKKLRTWDTEALKSVKDFMTTKEEKAKTPAERESKVNAQGGVPLIVGFQRGFQAEFITFHLESETVVRTKINKDPRGELPIQFAFGDIDGSNPFGRSLIAYIGSLQNLLDGEVQMYQYNRALMLNPPLIKKGNFSTTQAKFAPNAIIDLGTDITGSIEPLKIDTSALANFPANYGLMKSQILNIVASPDTSISAEVGNPGFSKTPAGVNTQNAIVSVDDNYLRKQFETWFERWSETAINLYFAERTGVEELQLDRETADKLRKMAEQGKFDPTLLSDDNKIRIDYDTATPALKFEVDASTSKMQDDIKQLQSLTGLTDLLDKSPFLQQVVPPPKQIALWNALVSNSGIENPEELTIDARDVQMMQQQAMVQQQAAAQAQQQQAAQQLPQQPQPQFAPEDQAIVDQMRQLGVPPDMIGRLIAMRHSGVPDDQIMQMVQQIIGGQ